MTFNSLAFAAFFPIVFLIYWAFWRSKRLQNWFLLAASWIFYAWWDWRFLSILIILTFTTFFSAILAERSHRKLFTAANVVVCLATLAVFKYFNFFGYSLCRLLSVFGWELDWFTLEVLLPVGISFYTFQAVGYSIDVYRGDVRAERSPVVFATFLAYFPQIMAGPIERASDLIPRIANPRRWDYPTAVDGARQALWGLCKKVFVADTCAVYVNNVYSDIHFYATPQVLMATMLFAVQIYCDFSGYCDIARGVSRCLGIEIMQNFRFPLFSQSCQDLWRRWNISLGLWARNYIYIPLGGSRRGTFITYRNLLLTFAIIGLWHGANATFIVWGVWWGVALCIERALKPYLPTQTSHTSPLRGVPLTFGLFILSLAFFRAESLAQGWEVFGMILPIVVVAVPLLEGAVALCPRPRRWLSVSAAALAAAAIVTVVAVEPIRSVEWLACHDYLLWTAAMLAVEWRSRHGFHALERMPRHQWARYAIYFTLIILVLTGYAQATSFIYFQF